MGAIQQAARKVEIAGELVVFSGLTRLGALGQGLRLYPMKRAWRQRSFGCDA